MARKKHLDSEPPLIPFSAAEQARLLTIAEQIKTTCLFWGTSVHTAYTVAGLFVEGIAREWRQQKKEEKEAEWIPNI